MAYDKGHKVRSGRSSSASAREFSRFFQPNFPVSPNQLPSWVGTNRGQIGFQPYSGAEEGGIDGSSEIGGWTPYCGAAPLPADWWVRWNFDPWLLTLIVPLAFAMGAIPANRAQMQARWSVLACFLVLFVSPFCALSSALFTARVVHHVILATVLAPLIVAGWPGIGRRPPGSLAIWTALQALVFWAWHGPPVYEAALSNDAVFWLMQCTITASAVIWWDRLQNMPAAASVASLLAAMVLMGVLGALITFAETALYAPHWLTTQPWGLSPLEDQQIGGIIMWAPASAFYLGAAMITLYRDLGRAEAAR